MNVADGVSGGDLGGGHVGVAEQVADVDQVDAGLDQVHGPAPPERVRRDLQAGSPDGVAGPDAPRVAGQQLGHPGPGQRGVVRPGGQRVCVCADAGMPVAVVEVVADEPGGRVHHGHVPDLGALPADHDGHGAAAVDVGDVEVAELLDAGGGVVGEGEQDGVPDGACAGRAGLGEQRLDLVAGQVAGCGAGVFFCRIARTWVTWPRRSGCSTAV